VRRRSVRFSCSTWPLFRQDRGPDSRSVEKRVRHTFSPSFFGSDFAILAMDGRIDDKIPGSARCRIIDSPDHGHRFSIAWLECRFYWIAPCCLRHYLRHDVSLQQGDHAQDPGKQDAVPEGALQYLSLLPNETNCRVRNQ